MFQHCFRMRRYVPSKFNSLMGSRCTINDAVKKKKVIFHIRYTALLGSYRKYFSQSSWLFKFTTLPGWKRCSNSSYFLKKKSSIVIEDIFSLMQLNRFSVKISPKLPQLISNFLSLLTQQDQHILGNHLSCLIQQQSKGERSESSYHPCLKH